MSSSTQPFEVTLPFIVRTYDIDYAGIVSNQVYIRWLEDLRFQMGTEYIPFEQQINEGYVLVLASTHIDYKRPIKLFDSVSGRMWIEDVGMTRVMLAAEIHVNGHISAIARHTLVFVDAKTLRPIPAPRNFQAQFAKFKAERQKHGSDSQPTEPHKSGD